MSDIIDIIDSYPKDKPFALPKEYCYGVQKINHKNIWEYVFIFRGLTECLDFAKNYEPHLHRIVLMSTYYPYPPMSVVWTYKKD